MVFETDLDYKILSSLSEDELFDYIEQNFVSPNTTYYGNFNFRKTCRVMKVLCEKVLGINPSPEQWVFLLADCERLLCEACAGAGKTTMAQLRSVKEKLAHGVAGINILALAYNTHAVDDMKSRHDAIIRKVNDLKLPELHRDSGICCHTFHSFCKGWVEEYLKEFNIFSKANYLMSDLDRHNAMQLSLSTFMKKYSRNIFVTDSIIEALLSVYSYVNETLTVNDLDSWKLCPSISDLSELKLTEIKEIFNFYKKWKTMAHKMDFTDLVEGMYKICSDSQIISRIRTNYQVFILDEYQDFTPSMLRIIKLIIVGDEELGIGPFTDSRLTCIGDGDQSIYGFRGTDPDNCIRFKDIFDSPGMMTKVTAMSENRRCPDTVIKYARAVIESNTRRINKPVKAIKSGGDVSVYNYSSVNDEMQTLIQKIKRMSEQEYRKTCICYRNQSSSYMLGFQLMREGIPFKVNKGHSPLTDKLSQTLFDTLNMLSYPDVLSWADKALYKVLPKSSFFTKKQISELIQQETDKRKAGGEIHMFYNMDFPDQAYTISGFAEALKDLEKCRIMHRHNKPMSTYLPILIRLIRKYYLDWQISKGGGQITQEYVDYITSWFCQDKDYDTFMKEYRNLLDSMNSIDRNKVTLTTLHGLKGLEFDNVYIIDLSDDIFPGTELNQSKDLSPAQKDALECEARRLFYVALTRSRENLVLFFDSEIPSRYCRFFTQNTGLAESYKQYIREDGDFLLSDIDTSKALPDEDVDISLDIDVDDLSDLDIDTAPEVALVQSSALSDLQSAMGKTSIFDKLEQQQKERDEHLREVLGEDNYNQIKGKPVLAGILDRVFQGGK